MIIHFKSNSLRKICEDRKTAVRKLGDKRARALRARLAEIAAAECVGELRAGQPHPLTGDRKGQFALRLDGACRLIFTAYDQSAPVSEQDWTEVSELLITEITDYHG